MEIFYWADDGKTKMPSVIAPWKQMKNPVLCDRPREIPYIRTPSSKYKVLITFFRVDSVFQRPEVNMEFSCRKMVCGVVFSCFLRWCGFMSVYTKFLLFYLRLNFFNTFVFFQLILVENFHLLLECKNIQVWKLLFECSN